MVGGTVDERTRAIITELSVLATTIIVALGLWWRSVSTGEDIPNGWALLIGSAWGALLGVRELIRRTNGGKDNE